MQALNSHFKATTTTNGNDKFYYGKHEFYFTPGVDYFVKETKAPAGYNINSTIFKVTAVAKAYTAVGTVENGAATVVKDYPVTVPQTGGMGTMMFYVGGAALIACAGVLLFVLKRKKAAK